MIHAAHVHRAEKLMFLGSSCIYPKLAPRPIREDAMLTGPQGAEQAYLPHTSFAMSTASFSFAHCSSSERMLPSSVEAKPHCGDSAS